MLSEQTIANRYQKSAKIQQISTKIEQGQNHFQISNLVGSLLSFVISETFKSVDKPFVVILNDKEEAAYYLNDIERLL